MTDLGHIKGQWTAPSTVQCRLIWQLPNSKIAHNVLFGSVAGGFIATSVVAQAIYSAIIASAAWTGYVTRLNSLVSFVGVDLRDKRTMNLPYLQSTGAATPGTGAGTALPEQDALAVTLKTDFAGRGFRGRIYLPGFDSTAMAAGGVASAATMSDAEDFVTEVQTAMGANGLVLGIAQPARADYTSAKTGTHFNARAAAAPITVTDIAVRDNVFDAQRRRSAP